MSNNSVSKSVLKDLNIDPHLMFDDPAKFQELCLSASDYLFGIMSGNESTADKKARELIKLAAASTVFNQTENIKSFKLALQENIFDQDNGRESSYSNEELAGMVQVLEHVTQQVRDHIAERFAEDQALVIKSKRAAASLYQRLRIIHDSWRNAIKLMDDTKYRVIPGRPGNYSDSVPYTFYLFHGEEYTYHTSLVRELNLEGIKTVGDFHDWVRENPDSGVRIMEA